MHLPHSEVSGTTSHYCSDYSNEIFDKLKATQTSKNIPFHLILFSVVFSSFFLFKRALFPEETNTSAHRMHLFLAFKKKILSVSVRPSCRPSVSMSFCGNLISNWSIAPKIGLNIGYGVVHVRYE